MNEDSIQVSQYANADSSFGDIVQASFSKAGD
jgi:hypothetical protein